MKMGFVASIMRHELSIIYAFVDFFFSNIIFYQKLFSDCCDDFDYLWSAVYLSCFIWLIHFDSIKDDANSIKVLTLKDRSHYLIFHTMISLLFTHRIWCWCYSKETWIITWGPWRNQGILKGIKMIVIK